MKKRKLSKNTKIIILIVTVILIIILNIILNTLEKKEKENKNENKNEIVATTGFDSIEDILNYYGCEFIKETSSKEKDFSKDIYLKFKYNTFEGEESNQRYYENIMGNIFLLIKTNYRLIDQDKNITIEVKTENEKYSYCINGNINYFNDMKSKLTLKNYEKEESINLEINSHIINDLFQNDWSKNVDFGTKETVFENYEIYFDEGIEVRKISGKVHNVIFTEKYQDEIVNNIKVGTEFEEIISKLGDPIYQTEDSMIIGYKSDDMYIFFSNSEISIYRNEKYSTEKFEKLIKEYIEEKIDLKEFMNQLTYLWDDYSTYVYDSKYIYIRYPLKGVEIEMTSDSPKGIKIYNNYSNIEQIKDFIDNDEITGSLNENLVLLETQERYIARGSLLYQCEMEKQARQNNNEYVGKDSSLYTYYTSENEISFISKNGENPNITIKENVNSGFWYNDTIFIYSVPKKGIYSYDLNNKQKNLLLKGNDEFKFIEYNNNILTYDDNKQIQIN